MSSLKSFHLAFILIVFVAADLFGAWGVWTYRQTSETLALIAGILSFLFGFALVGYTIWLMHKLDRTRIE